MLNEKQIEECIDAGARQSGERGKQAAMNEYLIEVWHDSSHEQCSKFFESLLRAGVHFVTRAHWGCEAGVHTGWLMIEAMDDCDAALMVPPVLRHQARVVRLNRFTTDDVRALGEARVSTPASLMAVSGMLAT